MLKICWYSDAAFTSSAYGKITRSVVLPLHRKGIAEFTISCKFGVENADLMMEGVRLFPHVGQGFSEEPTVEYAKRSGADCLFIHCDLWALDTFPKACRQKALTMIGACTPINYDAIYPSLAEKLNACFQVTTMSRYGERLCRQAGYENIWGTITPGVDTGIYRPLAGLEFPANHQFAGKKISREWLQAQFGFKNIDFLIGLVQMNRVQKIIPLQLEAIKIFMENNPDIKVGIYLHCVPVEDYDLPSILAQLELTEYTRFADSYAYFQGWEEWKIATLYNSFDCVLEATTAEGFGMPCLPPSEKIVTYNGLKSISEVKVGDYVLTHKGTFRRVLKTHRRNYDGNLIHIRPHKYFRDITMTAEHPVYALKRPKKRRVDWMTPREQWIPAGNLEEGDCVIMPTPKQMFRTMTENTPALAELIGWYIAEGSPLSEHAGIELDLNSENEQQVASNLTTILQTLHSVKTNKITRLTSRSLRIYGSSWILGALFPTLCGEGARNKRLPRRLLYGPLEPLRILLQAIASGDGSITSGGVYRYSTSSEELAHDITQALLRLGQKPSIQFNPHHSGEFTISYTPQTVYQRRTKGDRSWFTTDNGLAVLINHATQEPYVGEVYNLEVEEDNSYTTAFFSVHNCIEGMACGKPVVATNATSLTEILEPTPELLVKSSGKYWVPSRYMARLDYPDMYDVAMKLETVLNGNPAKYARKVRSHVKRNYDWRKRILPRWVEFIRDLEAKMDRQCVSLKYMQPSQSLQQKAEEIEVIQ